MVAFEPMEQVCPERQHHPFPQSTGFVPHMANIVRTPPAELPVGCVAIDKEEKRKANKSIESMVGI